VWTCLQTELKPETQNSFWAFDSADDQRVAPETLAHWYEQHDAAYQAELRAFLDPLPEAAAPSGFEAWSAFLRSARGAVVLRAAFERKAREWRARISRPHAPSPLTSYA
jgi:hypothetical protein